MRILGGHFKGKKLLAGKNHSIRPTTNRIKDIIFSILGDACQDSNVLDLFCGSGSLGLEALSRGAKKVTFIDKFESSVRILRNNIALFNIDPKQINILIEDAFDFCRRINYSYNLMLADPPFKYAELQDLVNTIFKRSLLLPDGILLIHHEISNPLQQNNQIYNVIKQKKIGRSLITFIIKEADYVI